MIVLYAVAPGAVALATVVVLAGIGILGSPMPFMGKPSPMPEVTSAVFILLGIAMPLIQVVFFPKLLGILSPRRATLLLIGWAVVFGGGKLVLHFIQPSFGATGFAWPYYLGIRIDMITLFVILAPGHIAMERAARARKIPTNCEKCEYDLTGNVSGVCPECGTALSEALRQHLHRRGENAWGAEQASAKEMDKE